MDRDVLLALLPFMTRDDFAAVHVQALQQAAAMPDQAGGPETFGELSRL